MFGIVAAVCVIAALALCAVQFASPYEQFQNAAPYKWEVELPMVADSTVESAVEIQTGIPAGAEVGWNIVGLEYQILGNVSPYLPGELSVTGVDGVLQLCRGNVPNTPVKLSPFNNDVITEHSIRYEVGSATGIGPVQEAIYRHSCMEQTQLPHLYLLFVTNVDWASISTTAFSIFCNLLYYPVAAPTAPREML